MTTESSVFVELGDFQNRIEDDRNDGPMDSFEGNINTNTEPKRRETNREFSDFGGTFKEQVTTYVWSQGTEQAKKAYNLYGNVDLLRPYFNADPATVKTRLLNSLVPPVTASIQVTVVNELYGPTMIVFTLIALLLFSMKRAEHTVKDGTLMGSSMAICFGYWIGSSSLVYLLNYIFSARFTFTQILSLLGYALFGHCVVVVLTSVFHPFDSHYWFYLLFVAFGGLSAIRLVLLLCSRIRGKSQRLIAGVAVASMHLLFLLYLHFAYHKSFEVISAVD